MIVAEKVFYGKIEKHRSKFSSSVCASKEQNQLEKVSVFFLLSLAFVRFLVHKQCLV